MFEKICGIIADKLSIDEDIITMESDILDDLGADSLDVVELIMAFEDEFDTQIPDGDIEQLRTVQSIVDYLENL